MKAWAYYNEIDKQKAAWIRALIKTDVVAPGEVDERSIADVQPDDLRGFRQCHFFAGIAVWSYALRLAGVRDDEEWWTGSCPCPSFSCAGKGEGFDDPRHLWPDWFRLIEKRKPARVLGEQSDDAIGFGWLDLVQAQMESADYALGKAVLASASVGGSDIRQRLYFAARLADADRRRCEQRDKEVGIIQEFGARRESGRLGNTGGQGHQGCDRSADMELHRGQESIRSTSEAGSLSRLAYSNGGESRDGDVQPGRQHGLIAQDGGTMRMADSQGDGWRQGVANDWRGDEGNSKEGSSGVTDCGGSSGNPFTDALKGYWRDADWLLCTDGKWRPVESGTFPLAHGITNRLVKLRGYGDAINARLAKGFIEAYLSAEEQVTRL